MNDGGAIPVSLDYTGTFRRRVLSGYHGREHQLAGRGAPSDYSPIGVAPERDETTLGMGHASHSAKRWGFGLPLTRVSALAAPEVSQEYVGYASLPRLRIDTLSAPSILPDRSQ